MGSFSVKLEQQNRIDKIPCASLRESSSIIGNLQLFVAYKEKWICMTTEYVRPIPTLESNQEEAIH